MQSIHIFRTKFQVIHGQCDFIIFRKTFSLGSAKQLLDLPLGDNGVLSTGPGFYPQILELHALLLLFVRDLLNSK